MDALVRFTRQALWPTAVGLYEADPDWAVHAALYEEALRRAPDPGRIRSASERRVRGILDHGASGAALRSHLFGCARHFLGPHGAMLDPDYCENRALVIGTGGFISTHKDSREGDIACTYFLTGSGGRQPLNSVGDPRFVLEDPSRYFDEARLPFEERHGYSVNPRPGLAVVHPSHIPHNQHPYTGSKPHVQIVAVFRVHIPTRIDEEMFD